MFPTTFEAYSLFSKSLHYFASNDQVQKNLTYVKSFHLYVHPAYHPERIILLLNKAVFQYFSNKCQTI